MGGQAGRGQFSRALTKHGLDSLDWLRPGHGARAAAAVTNLGHGDSECHVSWHESSHLICGLQSSGKIHESLNLDAISRTHVGDVVEVGGGTDHLGPTIRIPAKRKFIKQG